MGAGIKKEPVVLESGRIIHVAKKGYTSRSLASTGDILHVYDNTNSKPVRIVRKHKDDITIYPNKDWSETALLSLINA